MLAGFYKKHIIAFWSLIVIIPILILAIGCMLAPDIFWEQFVYKYFWGPIVSDLEGRPVDGITEGYNIVNTIVYALLLAAVLLIMYKVVKRLKITMDLGLIAASIPFFLFGGVSRALEDALLFQGWLGYWFISPLIYVMIGLLFAFAGITGYLARRKTDEVARQTLYFIIFVIGIMVAYYLASSLGEASLAYVLPPYIPLIAALLSILVFYLMAQRGVEILRLSIFCTGLLVMLISTAYAASFAFSQEWQSIFTSIEGFTPILRPMEAVIIPGIALALTAMILVAGKVAPKWLGVLAIPTSLLMFLAHFLDGAATYRGIDLYGYAEKHVLPTALIDFAGTGAVMLLLKFLLVLVIILLIDVLFKKDLQDYPGLGNIMKFAVIFLGMAPGTRDLVRISLGV